MWTPVAYSLIAMAAGALAATYDTRTASATPEDRLVVLVNEQRLKHGLLPLKREALLDRASATHAANMSAMGFVSHCDPDTGTTPQDRMRALDDGWTSSGENIAAGWETAERVMGAWMASPGHRANILRPDFREIGVGYRYQANDRGKVSGARDDDGVCRRDGSNGGPYRHYWSQSLGARDSVYPIVINGEEPETEEPRVSLYLYGKERATEMRLRNESGAWSEWRPFAEFVSWALSPGNGEKEVEVELRAAGAISLGTAKDRIRLGRR